jgi:putative tricarboxylic transport membrane protein
MENLLIGLNHAFSISNLFYCFFGVSMGLIVGMIPGLGTIAALSMLLPFTYAMQDPIGGLIMMSGIYYGSQYGGNITSTLFGIPGEVSSVPITKDAHELAKKGHASSALSIATLGSFIAGCIATFLILYMSPPLMEIVYAFGPKEYCSLIIFSMIFYILFCEQEILKSLIMLLLGMLFSLTGVDLATGQSRYVFDFWILQKGFPVVTVLSGLFGIGGILFILIHQKNNNNYKQIVQTIEFFPKKIFSRKFFGFGSIFRGTAIGSLIGLLPGAGGFLASYISYNLEKRILKNKTKTSNNDKLKFIASAESGNNAGAQTSFIPLLSLGFPLTPVMALLLATMIVHGIEPGPAMFQKHSDLFYTLVTSMWVGNLFLLLICIFTVRWLPKIMNLSLRYIFIVSLITSIYIVYDFDKTWQNLFVLLFFSFLGYMLSVFKYEFSPLILGFMLGPRFEDYLRQSLIISKGDLFLFFDSKLSFLFYLASFCLILWTFYKKILKTN